MIKSLKKYQIQLTPFEATKDWALNNSGNDNLLLMEDGSPVALEYLEYGDGSSFPNENSYCDIALQQQDADQVEQQEGLKVTGPFYPDSEPSNPDGTPKRSIYHQVRTMFYNSYLNPTEIWGNENIDFQLGKTKRKLSDKFRLVEIPRLVYGDKITPKSIVMYDNTLDVPYIITDDGNGNLFAGTNIFSHQQELGHYSNGFVVGKDHGCDWYWMDRTYVWVSGSDVAGVSSILFNYGTMVQGDPYMEGALVGGGINGPVSFLSGAIFDTIQPATGSPDYGATMNAQFSGGLLFDTVQPATASYDYITYNVSPSMSFNSGALIDAAVSATASYDYNVSPSMSFNGGFITITTKPTTQIIEYVGPTYGFYTGSIV